MRQDCTLFTRDTFSAGGARAKPLREPVTEYGRVSDGGETARKWGLSPFTRSGVSRGLKICLHSSEADPIAFVQSGRWSRICPAADAIRTRPGTPQVGDRLLRPTVATRTDTSHTVPFVSTATQPAPVESLDQRKVDLKQRLATGEDNTEKAVAYCIEHPPWRLSLQIHKLLGIR